jgi:hypothetical protein
MKMHSLIFVTFVTLLFSAFSCYYDNEETLYPNISVCDTSNITFSRSVLTMLSDNCFSCHSSQRAPANGNNISLQSYADVSSRATSISAAINHTAGVTPMPKNGGKLNLCLIRQFDLWMQKGSPDN